MRRRYRYAIPVTVSVVCVFLLLFSLGGSSAAAQPIDIEGEFEGVLVGYNEEQADQSHEIVVEGEFTVNGENAQDAQVIVEPGPQMLLDQGSVEAFVEGEREISFDRADDERRVVLSAEEIPSDTTIRIDFMVVFVGGTDEDELNAGSVIVEYETAGGTPGEASFDATTDMSESADNRIASLQSEADAQKNWRLIGIAGGAIGLLAILAIIGMYLKCCRDTGPTRPDNLP